MSHGLFAAENLIAGRTGFPVATPDQTLVSGGYFVIPLPSKVDDAIVVTSMPEVAGAIVDTIATSILVGAGQSGAVPLPSRTYAPSTPSTPSNPLLGIVPGGPVDPQAQAALRALGAAGPMYPQAAQAYSLYGGVVPAARSGLLIGSPDIAVAAVLNGAATGGWDPDDVEAY